MEEPFDVSFGFRQYTVTPTGGDEFIVEIENRKSIIQRTLDEFNRWELIEGDLDKYEISGIGEQIELFYDA